MLKADPIFWWRGGSIDLIENERHALYIKELLAMIVNSADQSSAPGYSIHRNYNNTQDKATNSLIAKMNLAIISHNE